MKNIFKKTIGYGFLFIAMALIIVLIEDRISTALTIPYQETVVILCLITAFALLGTMILASTINKKELKVDMMNTILSVVLIAYVITLLKVLFFDRTPMYSNHNIYSADMRTLNLVPFETIKLFIKSWQHGYLSKGLIISNICGNIVMFLPLVVLLWCVYKPFRRKWLVVLINFIIVVVVEFLQYIFAIGSCDIDDLILNMIGIILGYFIVTRKTFQNLCKKIYIIE